MSLFASRTTFIYGLRDPSTGKVRYVGKSDNPDFRFYLHRWDAEHRPSRRLHSWIRSLKKKGIEPELFVIEECSIVEWEERERFWIAHYRAQGVDLVNHTAGGEGLCDPSPEVRAKMSARQRGKKRSPEEVAKRTRWGEANHFYGKHHSEESKAKQRAAKLGKPSPKKGKPAPEHQLYYRKTYVVIDPNGAEFLVKNLPVFCRENNLTRSTLLGVLSGKWKHHKGWRIRRPDEG